MVRVLFVHPDLGIGGAERLVVDAAVALKNRGHSVSFLTNHHDIEHCFEETRNGTFPVVTVGDWLPRSVFGKFAALCAYIRMVYAAFYTSYVLSRREHIDIIFCDLISLGIPIFRLAAHHPKVLFYCHFPDQLLTTGADSALRRFYRAPLNYLEELTTGSADGILVNSKFTRRVFKETFRSLSVMPAVLYPSLNTKFFDDFDPADTEVVEHKFDGDSIVFLSLNRYERKKNLPLALHAFKALEANVGRAKFDKCYLVMAGGYDRRVVENLEHYEELVDLAQELGLTKRVVFLRSPSDQYKMFLLQKSEALIYTPHNEHFGIVPIESMYMRRPVVAVNSGGPTETVIHESTGFLCEQSAEEFGLALAKFVNNRTLKERMGEMGRKRVQQKFSFEAFTDQLHCIVEKLLAVDKKKN